MLPRHMALTLTADERTELERRVRSRKIRAEDAKRAQVILMQADGESVIAWPVDVHAKHRRHVDDERDPVTGGNNGFGQRCAHRQMGVVRASILAPAAAAPWRARIVAAV